MCGVRGSEGGWVCVADKGGADGAESGGVDAEVDAKWTFLLADVERLPCWEEAGGVPPRLIASQITCCSWRTASFHFSGAGAGARSPCSSGRHVHSSPSPSPSFSFSSSMTTPRRLCDGASIGAEGFAGGGTPRRSAARTSSSISLLSAATVRSCCALKRASSDARVRVSRSLEPDEPDDSESRRRDDTVAELSPPEARVARSRSRSSCSAARTRWR